MKTINEMTKAELVAIARELSIKGYSKLNKESLAELVNLTLEDKYESNMDSNIEELAEEECASQRDSDIENANVSESIAVNAIKNFDFDKYANYDPNSIPMHMRTIGIFANQMDLVKALENNYKVSISTKDVANRYDMSVKIAKVYAAIKAGKVTKRSDEEILARVRNYKPTPKTSQEELATPKQLALITTIEKRSGMVNKQIVSSKAIANKIINEMLAIEKSQIKTEVATTNIETKLATNSFRTKFSAMLKRVFA